MIKTKWAMPFAVLRQLRHCDVQVMDELVTAAEAMDADPAVRVIIITGDGPKAFAAGADIKEMSTLTYSEVCRPGPGAALGALCAAPTAAPP